ncbi:hypothetical protein CUMW_286580, partial [Citrus unshiu]
MVHIVLMAAVILLHKHQYHRMLLMVLTLLHIPPRMITRVGQVREDG